MESKWIREEPKKVIGGGRSAYMEFAEWAERFHFSFLPIV